MDAMQYWDAVGTPKTHETAKAAGTKFTYFEHIAHKRKHPSRKLAVRLQEASGGLMTFNELLSGPVTPEQAEESARLSAEIRAARLSGNDESKAAVVTAKGEAAAAAAKLAQAQKAVAEAEKAVRTARRKKTASAVEAA